MTDPQTVLDALRGADSLDPCGPIPPLEEIARWTDEERALVLEWAEDRRECARAQVEQDALIPAVLADWQADQDPDLEDDPEPLPVPASPARLSGPPPPPPFDPEVWRRPDGSLARTAAQRRELYQSWTDPDRFEIALQDPKLQGELRAQMCNACRDLERIREVEQRIREAGADLWQTGSAAYGALVTIPRANNYRVTEGVKAECARVLLIPEQLEAERAAARYASAAPAPAPEPPPAGSSFAEAEPPRWPARVGDAADAICALFRVDNPELDGELIEILMKLRSQRTTPPVLGATEPSSPPAAAAELAAAVSTLRVEAGLGPIPEGELPEAIRAVLADRDLQIGGLKRDLKAAEGEIEERDSEISAAWTALGDAQGATLADAIRSLLADRDRQIESQRAEIARLRAELDARPPRPEPAWHAEGRDLVYSAPPPPVLARVEADLDEPIWHWSVGDTIGRRRGTASSKDDAQAICDLFLGRAP